MGNVSYHVKKLVSLGVVELVDKRQVRGAVEHFYRAVTLAYVSDEEWAKLSWRSAVPTPSSSCSSRWQMPPKPWRQAPSMPDQRTT